MKLDISLIATFVSLAVLIFGVVLAYLSSVRLRETQYNTQQHRIDLDRTRTALEADIRRMYDDIYRAKGRWNEINHLAVDAANALAPQSADQQQDVAINYKRFLESFGIDADSIKVDPSQVFVLTPLADEESSAFTAVRLACEKAGLRAIKGDEQNIAGAILPVLIQEILRSRFVIANLNGRNPNVFYEMGIAQALGKDVLMFAHRREAETLPFDIAHQRIIFYVASRQLQERMAASIGQLGWDIVRSLRQ